MPVLLLKEAQLFTWPVSDAGYAGMARQVLPCSLLKAHSPKLNVASLKVKNELLDTCFAVKRGPVIYIACI